MTEQTIDQTPEKRSYRKTTEVTFTVLDHEAYGFEFEREERKYTPKGRSEYQEEMDRRVGDAYATSKPLFLVVAPTVEAVEDAKRQVRGSADFLGLGLKTGKVKQHPQTGEAIVSFLVVERIARPRKNKNA